MAPDAALRRRLLDAALLRGSFTLRSGATSDRYFDKYRVTCEPALLGAVGRELAEMLRGHDVDARRILAPAIGAVPLATALALECGLPFAIVRDAAKGYGTANRIEGQVVEGERAVLVEDVVTSGGAAVEAVEAGRAAGLEIGTALCLLDRDGGGREALAQLGVTLVSLLDVAQLDAAFDAGAGRGVVQS